MDTRGHYMTNETTIDPTSPEFPGYIIQALKITIGDEPFIKIRQDIASIYSITAETTYNAHAFYSGSFAEGIRLPSSDRDIMFLCKELILINDASKAKAIDGVICLQMNRRHCRPGFTRLKVLNFDPRKLRSNSLATSDGFLRNSYLRATRNIRDSFCQHGPSFMDSLTCGDVDFVLCLSCNIWPTEETDFRTRSQENNWPLPQIVEEIIKSGCHVVPVSSKFSEFEDSEWRISFSAAETKLVRTFNHTQFLCYGLLKLALNRIIKRHFPDMLCSYFMKTLIFWEIQESENKQWKEGNILQHFWKCLERLTRWVSEDSCPNFFIPEYNMFSCRFIVTQQRELLQFLRLLHERGNCIFFEIPDLHIVSDVRYASLPLTYVELTRCVLEIEDTIEDLNDNSSAFLTLLRSLPQNESSPEYVFVKETTEECIRKNQLCKAVLQFLSRGEQGNRERYEIYHTQVRCYMELLEEGSVTARLWAATARYAIGQYKAAIDIIEYVKEVVRPIYDNGLNQLEEVYQRKRTCLPVFLTKYYFVPELYPEVQAIEHAKCFCPIPPRVYADWLLFMCYHHSKDQRKRDAVLCDLHALLLDDCMRKCVPRGMILNMVGMCYALSGNHRKARRMFKESYDLGDQISPAALWRMQQLELQSLEQERSQDWV